MSNIIIAVPPCELTNATEYPVTTGAGNPGTVNNSGNLFTVEPSEFATLTSLDPIKCKLQFGVAVPGYISSTAIGCAGIRLPALTAQSRKMSRHAYYRSVIHDIGSAGTFTNTIAVSGVTGGTATGSPNTTSINLDPYTGGSTAYWQVGTSGFLIDFDTPGVTDAGGYQIVALQVQPQSAAIETTFTVQLYDNGSAVSTLRTVTLPRNVGMVTVVVRFDQADATPATTQIRVATASGHGGDVRVHRVRWYSPTTSAAWDSGIKPLVFHDDGVVTVPTGNLTASTPYHHLDTVGTTYVTGGGYIGFQWFCDALTDMSTAYSANDVLRVGRAWASGHVPLGAGAGFGSISVGVEDSTDQKETLGGQTTGAVGVKRRVLGCNLPLLTPEESAALFWRLDMGAGVSTPFMVSVLREEDGAETPDIPALTLYGTLARTDGYTVPTAIGKRVRNLTIREKL